MAESQKGPTSISSRGTMALGDALQTVIKQNDGSSNKIKEYFDRKRKFGTRSVEKPVLNEDTVRILHSKIKNCSDMRTNVNILVVCLDEFASNGNVIEPWGVFHNEISELCTICLCYLTEVKLEDNMSNNMKVFRKFCNLLCVLGELNNTNLSSALFTKCAYKLLITVFKKNVDKEIKELVLLVLSTLSSSSSQDARSYSYEKISPFLGYLVKFIMNLSVETQMSIYIILRNSLVNKEQAIAKANNWFDRWPVLKEAFIRSYSKNSSEGCGLFLDKLFELRAHASNKTADVSCSIISSCEQSALSSAKSKFDISSAKLLSSANPKSDLCNAPDKGIQSTPKNGSESQWDRPVKTVKFEKLTVGGVSVKDDDSSSDHSQAFPKERRSIFQTPYYPDGRKSLSLRKKECREQYESVEKYTKFPSEVVRPPLKDIKERGQSSGINVNIQQPKLQYFKDRPEFDRFAKPDKTYNLNKNSTKPSHLRDLAESQSKVRMRTVPSQIQPSLKTSVRNLEVEEDKLKVERWLQNTVNHEMHPGNFKAGDSSAPLLVDLVDEPEIEVLHSFGKMNSSKASDVHTSEKNYHDSTTNGRGQKRSGCNIPTNKKFKGDYCSTSVTDDSEPLFFRVAKLGRKTIQQAPFPTREKKSRIEAASPKRLKEDGQQSGKKILCLKADDNCSHSVPKSERREPYGTNATSSKKGNLWEQKLKKLEDERKFVKSSDVYQFDDGQKSHQDAQSSFKVHKSFPKKRSSPKNKNKKFLISPLIKSNHKTFLKKKCHTTNVNFVDVSKENINSFPFKKPYEREEKTFSKTGPSVGIRKELKEMNNCSKYTYASRFNQHNRCQEAKLQKNDGKSLCFGIENFKTEKQCNFNKLKEEEVASPVSAKQQILNALPDINKPNFEGSVRKSEGSPKPSQSSKEMNTRGKMFDISCDGIKSPKWTDLSSPCTPVQNKYNYSLPLDDSTEIVQPKVKSPSGDVKQTEGEKILIQISQVANVKSPWGQKAKVAGLNNDMKVVNISKDLDSGIDITSASEFASPPRMEGNFEDSEAAMEKICKASNSSKTRQKADKSLQNHLLIKKQLEEFLKCSKDANADMSQNQTVLTSELLEIKELADQLAKSVSRCQTVSSTNQLKLKEQETALEGCSRYLGPYEDQSSKAKIPATKYTNYKALSRELRAKNTQTILESIQTVLKNNYPLLGSSSDESEDGDRD